MRFSPYVTIGAGVSYFKYDFRPKEIYEFNPDYPGLYTQGGDLASSSEEAMAVPTLPFGMGIKYTIGERLGA